MILVDELAGEPQASVGTGIGRLSQPGTDPTSRDQGVPGFETPWDSAQLVPDSGKKLVLRERDISLVDGAHGTRVTTSVNSRTEHGDRPNLDAAKVRSDLSRDADVDSVTNGYVSDHHVDQAVLLLCIGRRHRHAAEQHRGGCNDQHELLNAVDDLHPLL